MVAFGAKRWLRPPATAANSPGSNAPQITRSLRISTPRRRAVSIRAAPSRCWRSGAAAPAASMLTCLKYWPPGCARSSTTTTAAPALRAAIAADRPPGPAPITSTSGRSTATSPIGHAPSTTGASARPCTWRRTCNGRSTLIMQARCSGFPSISTRQSWQTPMPQNRPRSAASRVVRSDRMPCAVSAAATLSPARAAIGVPSNAISMVSLMPRARIGGGEPAPSGGDPAM
jgi:hypothetical protein